MYKLLEKTPTIEELMHGFNAQKQEVLCLQEHRMIHEEPMKYIKNGKLLLMTTSSWRNEVNVSIGGVGVVLNNRAATSLVSAEKHTRRIMITALAGNPKTIIIAVYAPKMQRRSKKWRYSTRNSGEPMNRYPATTCLLGRGVLTQG